MPHYFGTWKAPRGQRGLATIGSQTRSARIDVSTLRRAPRASFPRTYFGREIRPVIRDVVFGMEDGLVSNLGLVLGVYIGAGSTFAVLLAGLASMFAGAFSMSAGSYLSAKSQREVYEQEIAVTKRNLQKHPERCFKQMEQSLMEEGLGKKEIELLFKKSSRYKHPEFVCNYMVQKKVGISQEKLDRPWRNALTMFFSFLLGSAFPIIPFALFSASTAVVVAVSLTILALFAVGGAKTIYTNRNWLKSGMEIVIVGIGAGIIGYLVGLVLGYGG